MRSSKYFIIDALGAFINPENTPMNWSKIPFNDYERHGALEKASGRIIQNFRKFAFRVAAIGYNAVSIDDLAHMAILACYSTKTKNIISRFQKLYKQVIKIATEYNLAVFVNLDIAYFNKEIDTFLKNNHHSALDIIKEAITYLFANFEVEGIITRIGECDGVDVKGMFRSRITIKTVSTARKYLKTLIPVFEYNKKTWIFRTWTIGGTGIGDLMWNKKTFLSVFGKIKTSNLIISMKYGVSDFFRNMELNPLFFLKGHNKIIELQTRREYDLFGELPYYTGWEYAQYYHYLKNNPEFSGISVWCQTGGWSNSKRMTFLHNSSPYVELNTVSCINIFKGKNPATEIKRFFKEKMKCNSCNIVCFFKKYNSLSGKILYPKDKRSRYFNKVYLPPLLWMQWGNISITKFAASFVKYYYTAIDIGNDEFSELQILGNRCKIDNMPFIIDTLRVIYDVRCAFHDKISEKELLSRIKAYSPKYNLLSFNFSSAKHSRTLSVLLHIMVRKKQRYRLVDLLLMRKPFIILLYLYLSLRKRSGLKFVDKQAMPMSKVIG